jgi:hypothetical protein
MLQEARIYSLANVGGQAVLVLEEVNGPASPCRSGLVCMKAGPSGWPWPDKSFRVP